MNGSILFPLAVIGTTALVASGGSSVPVPEDDAQVWSRIRDGGDVLMGCSFEQAVFHRPLLVDGLFMQRVVRPLTLLCLRVVRPWVSVENADRQLEEAFCRRNRDFRMSGGVTVEKIARSEATAWRANSKILLEILTLPTPESDNVRDALCRHRSSVRRAFDEARQVLSQAACVDLDKSHWWQMLVAVVDDMEAVVSDLCPSVEAVEQQAPSSTEDVFGAVSVDSFGAEYEEYIVSGHRAPSVGLPQYRRMGGRFY